MTSIGSSIFSLLWQGLVQIKLYLHFCYACFIRPFLPLPAQKRRSTAVASPLTKAGQAHQKKLEHFYGPQASVYDATRTHLLKGREQCLQLCAAYLKDQWKSKPVDELWVWIDIGGGTGFNIEAMNRYLDVKEMFSDIYLVDLTPSLCDEARKRFSRLGWHHVHVKCADAATWQIPTQRPTSKVMLNTFSYSLSMMPLPTVFQVIDLAPQRLAPGGILGIVDFLAEDAVTSSYPLTFEGGESSSYQSTRYISYFSRLFWQWWFELDGVKLHPCRRDYVVHMMAQRVSKIHKIVYGKNKWAGLPFIQLPYYVMVGVPTIKGAATGNVKLETLSKIPSIDFGEEKKLTDDEDDEHYGKEIIEVKKFNTVEQHWRQPYDAATSHTLFNTYLYAFVWEDPKVDIDYLNLKPEDNLLVITSGGCNTLEYLINQPLHVHAVDLNPCQNHLFELKLSAIKSCSHEELWQLFGIGHHHDFETLLNSRLSVHLSPHAYNYWRMNAQYFDQPTKKNPKSSLYLYGGSGLAMKTFQWIIKFAKLEKHVQQMCQVETLEEQWDIWAKHIKPAFCHPVVVRVLNNRWFLWNGCGVPQAQMAMLNDEGGPMEYLLATFDPLMKNHLLSKDQYFYYLCLNLRYRSCEEGGCPTFLTQKGYEVMQTRLSNVTVHTDTIANVCRKIAQSKTMKPLTKAVILDHMDWMDEALALDEIEAMKACMEKGGQVFWRSAAREPWYNELFSRMGFEVKLIHRRPHFNTPSAVGEQELLDRVNMYASFYYAVKL
jgi:betaine lipid synthase